MKRLFFDANIVADVILVRQPWSESAFEIMKIASFGIFSICCSSLTLGTISYLLSKEKFSPEIIKKKLIVFKNNCRVTNVGDEIVDLALHFAFDDFEDAMQYYSAMKEGCDVIITRNKKDFVESKIPIMEPQEFLDEFYKENEIE